METYLNNSMLREWSQEDLAHYQEQLQRQMAQLAIFYDQVLEERTRRWRSGETNG